MLFAADDQSSVSINAVGLTVNGDICTNGELNKSVQWGNFNGHEFVNVNVSDEVVTDEETTAADTEEFDFTKDMIYIHQKLMNTYFGENTAKYEVSKSFVEMNINISQPTFVTGKLAFEGNVNLDNPVGAVSDIDFNSETINGNNTVIYSKFGDIDIDGKNVSVNGLIYAPFGTVTVDADNFNLNGIIIAQKVEFNCTSNININYNNQVAAFVGIESENISWNPDDMQYMDDTNGDGIPDIVENSTNTKPENINSDDMDASISLYLDDNIITGNNGVKEVYFYVKTKKNFDHITLYSLDNGTHLINLFDNGDFDHNGDNIMGDCIYSGKYRINTDVSEKTIYSFYAIANNTMSNTAQLKIIPPFTSQNMADIKYVGKKIREVLNDNIIPIEYRDVSGISTYGYNYYDNLNPEYVRLHKIKCDKISATLDSLVAEGKLLKYVFDDISKTYFCTYSFGVNFVIITTDDLLDLATEQEDYPPIETAVSEKYSDINALIIDANTGIIEKRFNKKLVEKWKNDSMNIVHDTEVTVKDLKTELFNKDIIIYSGHGYYLNQVGYNFSFITLTDACTEEEFDLYSEDMSECRVIQSFGSGDDEDLGVFSVAAKFFEDYYGPGGLSGSFFCSESCEFFGADYFAEGYTDDYAQTLLGCSASAVIGFKNSVNCRYSMKFVECYLDNLLSKKNAIDSFNKAKKEIGENDDKYLHGLKRGATGYPYLVGDENSKLIKAIKNGDWETDAQLSSSIPCSWQYSGDCQVIDSVGNIKPFGNKMAFLSTGIGSNSGVSISGTQGSTMSQVFKNNYNNLHFKYNFISEEPMEYINSRYDDKFEFQILDLNDNILYSDVIESVKKSSWFANESINFAGGDRTAFHTGWKDYSVDISKFKGKSIKIKFLVYDVGDSAYDSAVVIDNINAD